jgi:hypothetical protein
MSIIHHRLNALELTGNLLISCAPVAYKKGFSRLGYFRSANRVLRNSLNDLQVPLLSINVYGRRISVLCFQLSPAKHNYAL